MQSILVHQWMLVSWYYMDYVFVIIVNFLHSEFVLFHSCVFETMVNLEGYCEGNSSLSEVWIQHGLFPCFYFTLVSTVLLSIVFFLGALQCACYNIYGTSMEPKHVPRSRLFHLQLLLTIILLLQFATYILWQVFSLDIIYGYMIVYSCLSLIGWACTIFLLHLERRRVMVRDRTRGHGTILLLFWALGFAAENLAFVSWESPLWWWPLDNTDQKVGSGNII